MKTAQRKNPDIFALFLPEIRSLLAAKDFTGLKQVLKNIRSVDIAYGWRHLESQDKIFIFKLFSAKRAVEVFESLNLSEQEYILNNLENADVSQIINEMAPDERADLFKDLPQKVSKKLFKFVNKTEEQNLRQLLNYEEGTAGSLMTTDLVEIKKDMSARQAIISLQENLRSDFNENVYSVFVTDENHKLLGSISLQDLIKAPPDILIKDVMVSVELVKIDPNTPQEEVSTTFKKYDLFDAPIVNKDNLLVGIITVDDIIETIEKRSTRDLYEIGKMDARGGEIISYATATMFDLVKRRAGWLILLLVFDFLTGTVLKSFQNVLSSVVALAFFIPMLLDTGGNAGAQASITIIRGLATGDVNFKNVLKVIKLEFAAALLMGVIVGIVAFARALLLQKDFFIAGVVGISMLFIAILAIATGIFLPLASKKVGLDPAVLAGPITTSIVDVVGLIIYFKIAQLFIPALQY
ncbi:MAG: magnesium transporter [Candidatus Omnitrophica bacterium CG12_big_fil_rev_8_21_14_0_65_43_15]|uniref:Magnesium transporter MgtE n=1 Tax=Candidatus Taenaricola geysiri TaxID=1974752 RepID=A0A2J0LDW7_9BACT|nr:MAG: magnesium transporter [Candidatus Omnitrophica bacterium CG10_big_fil_rev_8_21_14_0_10_43_8]PIW66045.1 MAG: magnesium transporter [Candidatus Omnitrophica bacterium CG12_big_fil_rev_8_21_14_0_65_43_15]PIW80060.1 MAG: magnesium transporter [Candidatus Omnitrophica bacterium CG_4_8_14_3_um_filter_43_15]PIY84862.1 MAG: magnesium transporter [Candidatus Omnitrophica bacterium CG_4_10_14_0_8_um_filter_43_18]PJC46326.1 MAG: magnesium transporter [Candidatus Omnitrophica bacterium CG_4_9_14_0_